MSLKQYPKSFFKPYYQNNNITPIEVPDEVLNRNKESLEDQENIPQHGIQSEFSTFDSMANIGYSFVDEDEDDEPSTQDIREQNNLPPIYRKKENKSNVIVRSFEDVAEVPQLKPQEQSKKPKETTLDIITYALFFKKKFVYEGSLDTIKTIIETELISDKDSGLSDFSVFKKVSLKFGVYIDER